MKLWLDIDNPPQVQYLLPFRTAFGAIGADTVITARDYGSTSELLAQAGVDAHVLGTRVGRSKLRKLTATLTRAQQLAGLLSRTGRPDALLGASRSAAIAAWRLRIPSFIIGDYEYANVGVYRVTGSTLLYPDVIAPAVFRRALRPEQLAPFRGIKEDLTFAAVDVESAEPYDLGELLGKPVRVLFRPPSETSHYYSHASSKMARATLAHLATGGALVIFSPRERSQLRYLNGLPWSHQPIILERAVPFVSLLKSVDAVVCSGGTMLREAAFLGIPAYSIFQSEIGAVDRWLQQVGRASLLSSPADLHRLVLRRRGSLSRLDSNPELLEELVALIASRLGYDVRLPASARAAASPHSATKASSSPASSAPPFNPTFT